MIALNLGSCTASAASLAESHLTSRWVRLTLWSSKFGIGWSAPRSAIAVVCALERNTFEGVSNFGWEKSGTTTSMPQELLFELNGARVTPYIATFGGTSYQI